MQEATAHERMVTACCWKAEALTKTFGGLAAVKEVSFEVKSWIHQGHHRPQRSGQDDPVRPADRDLSAGRGEGALPGQGDRGHADPRDNRAGHRQDLSDHPPLHPHDGDGERHGRPAPSHPGRHVEVGTEASLRTTRGSLDARGGHPLPGHRGPGDAGGQSGGIAPLRAAAPAGGGQGPGHAAADCSSSTSPHRD